MRNFGSPQTVNQLLQTGGWEAALLTAAKASSFPQLVSEIGKRFPSLPFGERSKLASQIWGAYKVGDQVFNSGGQFVPKITDIPVIPGLNFPDASRSRFMFRVEIEIFRTPPGAVETRTREFWSDDFISWQDACEGVTRQYLNEVAGVNTRLKLSERYFVQVQNCRLLLVARRF